MWLLAIALLSLLGSGEFSVRNGAFGVIGDVDTAMRGDEIQFIDMRILHRTVMVCQVDIVIK